jgi:hypothetical protein
MDSVPSARDISSCCFWTFTRCIPTKTVLYRRSDLDGTVMGRALPQMLWMICCRGTHHKRSLYTGSSVRGHASRSSPLRTTPLRPSSVARSAPSACTSSRYFPASFRSATFSPKLPFHPFSGPHGVRRACGGRGSSAGRVQYSKTWHPHVVHTKCAFSLVLNVCLASSPGAGSYGADPCGTKNVSRRLGYTQSAPFCEGASARSGHA